MKYEGEGMSVVCILLISVFCLFQKHTPCWEILLVSHAFFHSNITKSGIMSVPEMERNLTGVPQQVTMNKMKNGGFAQRLVRCCLSSLSLHPQECLCSLLVIPGRTLVWMTSLLLEENVSFKNPKVELSKFCHNLPCLAFGDPCPYPESKTTGCEQKDVILCSPLTLLAAKPLTPLSSDV